MRLNAAAIYQPVRKLGPMHSQIYKDDKTAAGVGLSAVNSAGLSVGILNRVRIAGEKKC